MKKNGDDHWLIKGSSWSEEEVLQKTLDKKPEQAPVKTVMVYWMDKKNLRKEPIGILMERRKLERENNNAIGMLRLYDGRLEEAAVEGSQHRIGGEERQRGRAHEDDSSGPFPRHELANCGDGHEPSLSDQLSPIGNRTARLSGDAGSALTILTAPTPD